MTAAARTRPIPLDGLAGRLAALLLPLLAATVQAQAPTAAQASAAAKAAAAPPPDAMKVGTTITTSSGLVFKLMTAGSGAKPTATDTVKVHYRGTLQDGKEFDSSYSRGAPAEFPLNRVIKCWTEGVQLLQVGGSAKLTCPPAIAYGEGGAGGVIPPNATLNFEVELLGISGR